MQTWSAWDKRGKQNSTIYLNIHTIYMVSYFFNMCMKVRPNLPIIGTAYYLSLLVSLLGQQQIDKSKVPTDTHVLFFPFVLTRQDRKKNLLGTVRVLVFSAWKSEGGGGVIGKLDHLLIRVRP